MKITCLRLTARELLPASRCCGMGARFKILTVNCSESMHSSHFYSAIEFSMPFLSRGTSLRKTEYNKEFTFLSCRFGCLSRLQPGRQHSTNPSKVYCKSGIKVQSHLWYHHLFSFQVIIENQAPLVQTPPLGKLTHPS